MIPQATYYLLAIILEIVVLIAAAVWAVGKIRSTTEALTANIKALGKTIDQLRVALVRVEDRQYEQNTRLARLEAVESTNKS